MSLLLDALKKAADDKKKISQQDAGESKASIEASSEDKETITESAPETEEVLTLDPVDIEEALEVEVEPAITPVVAEPDVALNKAATKSAKAADNSNTTSYTVSDEALSMLISKTNRDVKKSRRLLVISVLLVSLTILISGGVYYYMDMQAEIAALERKHQIAMHSMELKTNKEKAPDKYKIIRNLVSDAGLDDKVQYAKKHIAEKNNPRKIKPHTAVAKPKAKVAAASASVSFQKTHKVDPVAEKLEQAWQAYEDGQYKQAKVLYKEVLAIENDNRDAMLGLGAIAIIEKNNTRARNIYSSLLEFDPRDPVANAALASLRNSATEMDEKYLLRMLQKNPDDAHLSFTLGNVYAQQGKWKSAQKSYFRAFQHDNENADYIFNLAISLDQLGKHKQAIEFYQKCLNKSVNRQIVFSREAVRKRISELSGL